MAVNIGSWLFVRKFVPETKGTTLEELEDRFEAEGLQRAAGLTMSVRHRPDLEKSPRDTPLAAIVRMSGHPIDSSA